jgi:hypothetical protein
MRGGIGVTCALAMIPATIYWFVMGSFMTGEATQHSPRVNRRLPMSSLGRAFLTWFNPGPGTGYVFAVSNAVAVAMVAVFAVWYAETRDSARPGGAPAASVQIAGILLLLGYLTIYLGTSNLLLRLLRKFTQVNLATAVLVNGLLVLAGWGIPAIIDPFSMGMNSYHLGHVTDPFWTCIAAFDSRSSVSPDELLGIILSMAAAVFCST